MLIVRARNDLGGRYRTVAILRPFQSPLCELLHSSDLISKALRYEGSQCHSWRVQQRSAGPDATRLVIAIHGRYVFYQMICGTYTTLPEARV